MLMTILLAVFVLSMLAIVWTGIALYLRMRHQLNASETALRRALDELEDIQHEREKSKV
jgi:hypothetical protein